MAKRPQQHFVVTLSVPSANLATVLEVVNTAATLLRVEAQEQSPTASPSTDPHTETQAKVSKSYYRDGKRFKGISGQDLALKTLEGSPHGMDFTQIASAFVMQGFAGNSASPSLSQLKNDGLALCLGRGKWIARKYVMAKTQEPKTHPAKAQV